MVAQSSKHQFCFKLIPEISPVHDLPFVGDGLERMAEPVVELVGTVESVVGHEQEVVHDSAVDFDSDARLWRMQAGDKTLLHAVAGIEFRVFQVELAALLGAVAVDHVHLHAGTPTGAQAEGVDFGEQVGVVVLYLWLVWPEDFFLEHSANARWVVRGECECHVCGMVDV